MTNSSVEKGEKAKTIFTSGEVAALIGVSRITVNRWMDSGQIRGFNLPNSGDRRIPLESLLDFVRQYDLPLDLLRDVDGSIPLPRGLHLRAGDRRAVEIRAKFRVRLPDGSSFDSGEGFVRNLNAGGAFLSDVSLEQGVLPANPFVFDLELQEGALKGVKARGRPVRMSVGESAIGFGLQFEGLEEAARSKIERFVAAA